MFSSHEENIAVVFPHTTPTSSQLRLIHPKSEQNIYDELGEVTDGGSVTDPGFGQGGAALVHPKNV